MGTRAHFCTPNPSGRVDSSTQSTWLVAWQTPPGSLSIISTPSPKLGVLLGHSSLSPAPASVCGAGGWLLEPCAFGAVPRPYVHCQSGIWHTRAPQRQVTGCHQLVPTDVVIARSHGPGVPIAPLSPAGRGLPKWAQADVLRTACGA